ncbi:DNA endonuclease SmrA [Parahaliea mediterranea]|uniref:DNA endonuclease SmrA n=1 Tax=Parahaliea mediterranea TaxID=651086 RepID=A0A939DC33_9GAMM|nr:DNA endonuclease SmrA [Parahaliea mediterranea]MBN7795325.1 DNA endonuclease SmrA [Parahaliea mediterranea]
MADDEHELFEQEMAGVVPLRREERIPRNSGPEGRDGSLAHRRHAAVTDSAVDRNSLSDREIAPLDAWYVLDFKRPGVQNGVFRKLKQGRYEHEARLDMHRMTVAVARRELFDFIEQCREFGLRSVLLVHGKGERKPERERSAVLKGYVNAWLRDLEAVQAFHSAQPRHGGTGALYILLRKSEEKKRENRERFMKGRVPYDRFS